MERIKYIDIGLVFQLWDDYAAACTTGDFERWISLWNDDGVQMPPDVPRRIGTEEIRKEMQRVFDLFDMREMDIQAEEVQILGNKAYSHGSFTCKLTPKKGGEETKYVSGKFLDILEKQVDGSWKIAIDCHNYNMPARMCSDY